MDAQTKMERIAKHVEDFSAYSERAQGMQLMLAMCLKAGFPMPFPDTEDTNGPEPEKPKKRGA